MTTTNKTTSDVVAKKILIHHEGPFHESWDTYDEERYVIIDRASGEVLDDARGFGYKSARKAYAGYGYKHKPRSAKALAD